LVNRFPGVALGQQLVEGIAQKAGRRLMTHQEQVVDDRRDFWQV
jgi:hypothetical protein